MTFRNLGTDSRRPSTGLMRDPKIRESRPEVPRDLTGSRIHVEDGIHVPNHVCDWHLRRIQYRGSYNFSEDNASPIARAAFKSIAFPLSVASANVASQRTSRPAKGATKNISLYVISYLTLPLFFL